MSSCQIPPQSDFFYSGKWAPEMDNCLLSILAYHKQKPGWDTNDMPRTPLVMAELALKTKFGPIFSSEDVSTRMEFMELRYKTFKRITRSTGTFWDSREKCIIASTEIWNGLFRVCIIDLFLL